MKILYLPAYFYPEQAASAYLSDNRNQAFADAGFDMVVYTPVPTRGISIEERKKYKHRKADSMYGGRMIVYRFSLMREGGGPIVRALRYSLSCIRQFYWGCFAQEARQCDVMFISSTPPIQGAMAALIKKIRRIPLVYSLQDIFPDSLVGTGMAKKGGALWKVGRMIEDFTYRNADRIIVISEDFKRNIMAKGVPESKIEVIYNWVDETAIIPIPRNENPLFAEFGLDQNKFYVVYAGNLGSAQNIDILLEAANLLHDNSDIQFLVFGAEKQAEPYITKAKHMQLSNLKFLPLQPYEKVSCGYSLGDVAVVSCKQGFGDIAMPSKTWSIMSAGTAVLASFDRGTDMQYIIEKNRLGVFTEAENIQEFVKAVHILYSNPEECVQMGKRGRCYILEHLTREVGTRKYIGVIESIVGH